MIALVIVLAWLLAGSTGLNLVFIYDDKDNLPYRFALLAAFGPIIVVIWGVAVAQAWFDRRWVRR